MNEEYLNNLYQWISSQDDNFSATLNFDSFKQKMVSDNSYASRMYEWISDVDDTFTSKMPIDSFMSKIKTGPVAEVKKKDITDSSLGDGSSEQYVNDFGVKPQQQVQADNTQVAKPIDYDPAQIEKDKKDIAAYEKRRAAEMQAFNIAEKNKSKEMRAVEDAQRKGLWDDPNFAAKLNIVNTDLVGKNDSDVLPVLREKFAAYGFTFSEAGILGAGDNIVVTNRDGSKSITIDLDPYTDSGEIEESDKLRNFIKENAVQADEKSTVDNEISQALRAKQLRKKGRINDDGSVSTVKFQSANIDGKEVVYPTLFPFDENGDYGTSPDWWEELDGIQAYKKALQRGEVFTFETEAEAQDFANGSWKDVYNVDAEGQQFYNKKGKDYIQEKKRYNEYVNVRDQIDFLEDPKVRRMNEEFLTDEDKAKFSKFYVNGVLRDDYTKVLESLKKKEDSLYDLVMDEDTFRAREEWDIQLEEKRKEAASSAVSLNKQAKEYSEEIKLESYKKYGVAPQDLLKIVPKTEEEKSDIRNLLTGYIDAYSTQQFAVEKFELAKTYYDEKVDKNAEKEMADNLQAFTSEVKTGLNRGYAAEVILMAALGLDYDVNDPKSMKEAAEKIVEYSNSDSPEASRALTRFANSVGAKEIWDVIKSDPAELALSWAGGSLAQMLPYGYKILAGAVPTGAATGATVGLLGGPFAEVTVPVGAATGAAYGFRTGMSSINFAMEYTNEVLAAITNQGYDIADPESVAEALQDNAVWEEGRERGTKRGIPIAVVDFLTAGLAGNVFKTGALSSRGARIAAMAAERAIIDPIGEGVGELLAQVNVGDEINYKEIIAEMGGGIGNNSSHMAINIAKQARTKTNLEIADNLGNLDFISRERASDQKISTWSNNMESLGKITPEQNQRIQENVGLRKESRDLLGVGGNKKNSQALEARTMTLLAARKELSSSENRRSVFSNKIAEINTELQEIATNKELRSPETETILAGSGVIGVDEQSTGKDIRQGNPYYSIGKKRVTKEEFIDAINKLNPSQLKKFKGVVLNDEETDAILEEKLIKANPEQAAKADDITILTKEGKLESLDETIADIAIEDMTEDERQALSMEVEDLKYIINQKKSGSDAQFQLDGGQLSAERKSALKKRATTLMAEIQPDLSSNSFTVEESLVETTPVVVTENTELANKIGKMKVADLDGKKINLVMADQLKVDKEKMGGPFFPLIEGLFGKVAWASMDVESATQIIKGSIDGDYSIVYNMSPSAVDSNVVLLDSLIGKVKESKNSDAIFTAMMKDLSGKKFGKKTELVNKISKESKNLDEFTKEFQKLDVDTKAEIFKAVLPLANVKASTEVGILFAQEGITQESLRAENIEQFAADLPMGSMTMVLKITDKNGNPITKDNIQDAIITREQQKEEGLTEHKNYPVYIRGTAVAMMEDTVPFWSVNKSMLSTINAKIDGVIKMTTTQAERNLGAADTKPTTSKQARGAEMRRASMSAGNQFKATKATKTNYERFITKLTKSFPNTEVVTSEKEFDELASNLSAQKLMTKSQKVYGAVYNGKLYLNPALENYNTPVHEFGHLWINTAKSLSPKTYEKGLELVKGTQYESDVRNSKSYDKIVKKMTADGATEAEIQAYVLEEALATAIGDKGESFATAAQEKNFKAWLQELFDFIKKLTGISKLTAEQIQDLSLEEFTDAVVVDLLSENKAFQEAESATFSDTLQLMTGPNASISSILNIGRQYGFSDASIKQVLLGRGFKAADINTAMSPEYIIDLFKTMPNEFGNVEGGIIEGKKLFNEVRAELNRWAMAGPRGGVGKQRTKSFSEIRQKGMDLMRENDTFKAQPDQIQKEILSAFDRSIGIKANYNVQREISSIRNDLRQRKIGAENLRSNQIKLSNFVRKNLPKSNTYSQADINKLTSLIAKSDEKNFIRNTEKVLKIVESQRQKMKMSVIKDIYNLVDKKSNYTKTTSGKRRSGGLDAQGQSFFSAVKPILKAAIKNDVDAMVEIAQELSNITNIDEIVNKEINGEKLTVQEEATLNKVLAFDNFGDILNMELEEVQDFLESLKDVRKESIVRLKSRRMLRAAENKIMNEEATNEIKGNFKFLFNEDGTQKSKNKLKADRKKIWEEFKKLKIWSGLTAVVEQFDFLTFTGMVDFMRNNIFHLNTFSQVLDKYSDGFFTKNVFEALNIMDERQLQGYYKQRDMLDLMANSIPGITDGYKQFRENISDELMYIDNIVDTKTNNKWSDSYTVDELMRIYALSKNEVQRDKLSNMGFTQTKIAEIKDFIGADAVQMVDMTVEYLSNDYFESVNDVYSQVNDVNLGYVTNYFPTKTIVNSESKLLNDGNFNGIFDSENAPALKDRTDTKNDIELGIGFASTLENHFQTMERYKAYAEGVKKLNAIMNNPAVVTLLEETGMKSLYKNSINSAINPNSGPSATKNKTIVDNLTAKFVGFALAFKAIQVLKQATSFIQSFEDYSYRKRDKRIRFVDTAIDIPMFIIDYAKVVINLKSEIKKAQEISATFRNRIEKGMEGELYSLETGRNIIKPLSQENTKFGKFSRGFKKAGSAPTVAGDALGVMGYMANYNRDIANGVSKAEALQSFNNFNSTQQSRRASEKNQLQLSQAWHARAFTMFGSTIFLQLNKATMSMGRIMKPVMDGKPQNVKTKDIRAFVLNVQLANVAFAFAANIMKFAKGSDEDKDAALSAMRDAMMGLNLLYQIPTFGAAAEYLIKKSRNDRTPTSEVINPLLTPINKIEKAIKSDDVLKSIQPIFEMAIGTQVDPFIGFGEMITGQGDAESMYDILGISSSYRPGYGNRKNKSTSSSNKKTTKKDMKALFPNNPELWK